MGGRDCLLWLNSSAIQNIFFLLRHPRLLRLTHTSPIRDLRLTMPALDDPPPSESDCILPHDSYNEDNNATVLFIHGAFSSREEWDMVEPYISGYHLLIPDLPGHAKSRNITPFSVAYSARLLAKLIKEKAISGIAHVVGLSLGAHVAIALASHYPEFVRTVFVSGFEVFPPSRLSPYVPYIIWTMQRIENLVPRRLVSWLMDGAHIRRTNTITCTLALCRQIVNPMNTDKWPSPWPARTLIVAAGKGGIVPSSDHPHDAVRLAEIGRQSNRETEARTNSLARHPWNRQIPLLFAEAVQRWIEGRDLPSSFSKL